MHDNHSGEGAVPSVPNETGTPETKTFAGVLPPALPGQRAAMRLLDVFDQLTRHVQMLERRGAGGAPVADAAGVEFLNLQRENATLKARQSEARRRLGLLLQRIEAARQESNEPHEMTQAHIEGLDHVVGGGR